MRSPSRPVALFLLAGALLVSGAAPALAAETANSEFVIIRPGDVLDDDLYAGAVKVSVEGTIEGDLIAFAAEEVVIDGLVTGSVFAMAPRVTINGTVEGALRVTSGSLEVNGAVGRDVVGVVLRADFGPDSKVGRDLLVWAVSMSALGHVGRDVLGTQNSLSLAGSIDGDVDVSVGRLEIVDDLTVAGDLDYRSSTEAEGLENADVGGTIVRKTPLPPNIRVRALGLFGRFLVVVFLTITALGVAYGWPRRTRLAVERVGSSPLRSWGAGATLMLSPFLLSAAAAVVVALAPASASFPLLTILLPVVLAAIGMVFALSLVAGIPAAARLGTYLSKKLDLNGAVLLGSTVVGLVWLVPLIGWLVPFLVLPLGMGGWMLSWKATNSPIEDAQ